MGVLVSNLSGELCFLLTEMIVLGRIEIGRKKA